MDEFERLVDAYRRQKSVRPAAAMDTLMDLEGIRDARLVPFLLTVLRDRSAPEEVRIHVLNQLRNGDGLVVSSDRPRVANAIGEILAHESTATDLRLRAALALGAFTHVAGVLARLSAVCRSRNESIDLRYAAFTSLELGDPTPESVELLRQLTTDETLGHSARRVLSMWHSQQRNTS